MNWLNRWELYAFGSAFFAGLTAILGKLGVAGVNSNLATFIRTLIIIAVTAVILFIRDEWRKPESIPASTWLFLTLSGIATGLSWLCYYRALQLGPVTKVAPIDKLSVVFAILLGVLFLGEHLTWQLTVGGSLIVLGSLVMVLF
ncbi:MAG: EamA family transporter [Methylococcales bacterium]|nr:EamA family transporter [Methylococcales bacterium]